MIQEAESRYERSSRRIQELEAQIRQLTYDFRRGRRSGQTHKVLTDGGRDDESVGGLTDDSFTTAGVAVCLDVAFLVLPLDGSICNSCYCCCCCCSFLSVSVSEANQCDFKVVLRSFLWNLLFGCITMVFVASATFFLIRIHINPITSL